MKTESRRLRASINGRQLILWAAVVIAVGFHSGLLSTKADGSGAGTWYRAALEQGETRGYHWSVGVKGPKHEPLREICAQVSMIEPPQSDSPYVEETNSTDCGSLLRATDLVGGSAAFGSGPSKLTVVANLYRPIVHKVTFILEQGERKVFFPRTPKIPNRLRRGIPLFRYFAASFDGENCIRRVTTFNKRGKVVGNDVSPPCSPSTGNL